MPRLNILVASDRSKNRAATRNAPMRSPAAHALRILSVLDSGTRCTPITEMNTSALPGIIMKHERDMTMRQIRTVILDGFHRMVGWLGVLLPTPRYNYNYRSKITASNRCQISHLTMKNQSCR